MAGLEQAAVALGVGAVVLVHLLGREAEAVGEERHGQLGMVGPAMVALAVVLHRELPVAGLDDVLLEGDLGLAHVVRLDIGSELCGHLIEIGRRFVGEADEEQAGERADVHRLEAVAALLEVRTHMLGMDQVAGQIVGPGVVAADEVADRGLLLVDEPGAAVAADIVEGADLVVVVAHDRDRGLADLDDHDVAGLRHVGLDADIDPVPAEDDLHVGLEHLGAEVERGREGVAGTTLAQQALKRGRRHIEHGDLPSRIWLSGSIDGRRPHRFHISDIPLANRDAGKPAVSGLPTPAGSPKPRRAGPASPPRAPARRRRG